MGANSPSQEERASAADSAAVDLGLRQKEGESTSGGHKELVKRLGFLRCYLHQPSQWTRVGQTAFCSWMPAALSAED